MPSDGHSDATAAASSKSNKGKNVVGVSSFLSLKADLAERKLNKAKGKPSRSVLSSLEKPDKKLPIHLRPSPNVAARQAKSGELDHDAHGGSGSNLSSWANTPAAQLERSKAALERKAQMYEQLKRGRHGGLSSQDRSEGLIDWDRKAIEYDSDEDSGGSSEADSNDAEGLGADDPIIEYTDDLGRTRTARRSTVPLHLLDAPHETPAEETLATYGRQVAFPVYEAPAEAKAQKAASASAAAVEHFDSTQEVRNRGAGFFKFSADEATRQRQMQELETERTRTSTARKMDQTDDDDAGKGRTRVPAESSLAADAVGESVDGKRIPDPTPTARTAAQKRIADRRAEVEAKRRKLLGAEEDDRRKKLQQERRVMNFLDDIAHQAANGGDHQGSV